MEERQRKKKKQKIRKKNSKLSLHLLIMYYNTYKRQKIKKKGLFCYIRNWKIIMKLFKSLFLGIIEFILGIAIIPLTVFGIYWLFFKVSIGGIPFIKFLPYKYNDFCGLLHVNLISNGLLALIVGLLVLIGLLIVCIPYLLIVVFAFGVVCEAYVKIAAKRKDAFCSFFYEYENLFHLEHKRRLSGSEWLERRAQKAKEAEEKQKRREEERQKKQEESYQRQYQEEQETNYQNQNGSTSSEPSDLQKAMILFMFDDFDFTESELKKTRNRLIRDFHPDGSDDEEKATKYAQRINRYYEVLKPYAKK